MSEAFKTFIKLIGSENYGSSYDFIGNNYYKMSKEELKQIISEALYAMYFCLDRADEERCYLSMYEELYDSNFDDMQDDTEG